METQRAQVIAEARTWIMTPYHHNAAVKGAGVDCLMLIVKVAQACALIDAVEIPAYSTQFNLHRGAETYLEGLLGHGLREVESPGPADIALWQVGRCYAHAAIVTDWPDIIHASSHAGFVVADNVHTLPWLTSIDRKGAGVIPRPVKFLSIW